MDGCTFVPELYTTKGKEKPRNVNQFIRDQEKYLEYKQMNSRKKAEEISNKDKMLNTRHP